MSDRSPLQITLSVWKALYLREATFRLFGSRGAWAWLLIEPLIHFVFIAFLLLVIRQREVAGIHLAIWLAVGLTGFFLFRRTAQQAAAGIDANRALLTYRQVLPFDTIMVRALLEGTIMIVTFATVMIGIKLYGLDIAPSDPATVILAFAGLWIFGTALGILVAVLNEVAGEVRNVLQIVMMPLYFLSGVIFPYQRIPVQYRELLMYNPIANGLEAARGGFSDFYHELPETDLGYLYECSLVLLVLALVLYRRLTNTIMAR